MFLQSLVKIGPTEVTELVCEIHETKQISVFFICLVELPGVYFLLIFSDAHLVLSAMFYPNNAVSMKTHSKCRNLRTDNCNTVMERQAYKRQQQCAHLTRSKSCYLFNHTYS